ncbi:hypothetical protein [Bradyrhizobium sp. AUGA SZCCT0431]|uniref:hypothetical protein n=1 Tax=Bradyrhizobium sp. AUGA SZCCT0431 TaxID=2807674 RepID=UPI001BAB684C|nr:hypothetical protein [Bradyrhizobium sp. AUGA SZCCT0431]MBR1146693.1 hypothetical protein [Bradyrhizobium sp. AUGA SZCCT0431]
MGKNYKFDVRETPVKIVTMARDIDYLEFIFDVGACDTSILHEYFNPTKTKQITTKRLDTLASRPYTYIFKPEAQEYRKNKNYKGTIYDITEDGISLLIAYGRITPWHAMLRKKLGHSGPHAFWHNYVGSQSLGSIRLGLKQAGITYVSKYELFERMDFDSKRSPLRVDLGTDSYIPDDLFGAIYPDHREMFLCEWDMRSEPTERISSAGTSFMDKPRKIETGLAQIKKHFGIKESPFKVLTVTTSEGHMHDIISKMRKMPEPIRELMAFQSEETFSPLSRGESIECPRCKGGKCYQCKYTGSAIRPPDARIFQRDWLRAGLDPFNIGGEHGKEAATAT